MAHGRTVGWDGRSAGEWSGELEGAGAVVNLAGVSVDCRYTDRNRRLIMDSRVESTRVLGKVIAGCVNPPRVWLNSSTATIYKHATKEARDERGEIGATPEAKDEFSIQVALAWEEAFAAADTPRTRKVALRTSMVFGVGQRNVFPVMRRLVRLGLGGAMGSGGQFVSWLHEEDFARAVEWILQHENLSGPVNVCAPNPVTNREMMATFRRVCGVPVGLPAPEWLLEVGAFFLRTETELILKSRRVVPGRLLEEGFTFRHPELEGALRELEGRTRGL